MILSNFIDKRKGRIKQCIYSLSIATLFSRVKPNRRFRNRENHPFDFVEGAYVATRY